MGKTTWELCNRFNVVPLQNQFCIDVVARGSRDRALGMLRSFLNLARVESGGQRRQWVNPGDGGVVGTSGRCSAGTAALPHHSASRWNKLNVVVSGMDGAMSFVQCLCVQAAVLALVILIEAAQAGGHTKLLLTQGSPRKRNGYFEIWKAKLC